jgi:hypothetical protein
MNDMEPILRHILRKAELMQLDAKTLTVAADASEIKQLATMALKKLENQDAQSITDAGGGRRQDN